MKTDEGVSRREVGLRSPGDGGCPICIYINIYMCGGLVEEVRMASF